VVTLVTDKLNRHGNGGERHLRLQIRCSESAFEATFGPKRHCSYRCIHMSSYVVQKVQTSEFPVLSTLCTYWAWGGATM